MALKMHISYHTFLGGERIYTSYIIESSSSSKNFFPLLRAVESSTRR